MAGERTLRIAIRDVDRVLVVRLSGELDEYTYSGLLGVLLSCASMEPAGVVVELDELAVHPAARLVVFDIAWMFARRRPAVQLVLVAPDDGERPRRVPCYGTTEAALAAITRPRADPGTDEACPA